MRFENSVGISTSQCSMLCLAVCAVAFSAAVAQGNSGQAKKHAPHKTAAVPWSKYDCGQGTELWLSAPSATQGSLLLVEVRSTKPLSGVAGKWTDKEIPFWQSDAAAPKGASVWQALLGVDLEQAAGEYKLDVSGKAEASEAVSCKAGITVRTGKFATEKLAV